MGIDDPHPPPAPPPPDDQKEHTDTDTELARGRPGFERPAASETVDNRPVPVGTVLATDAELIRTRPGPETTIATVKTPEPVGAIDEDAVTGNNSGAVTDSDLSNSETPDIPRDLALWYEVGGKTDKMHQFSPDDDSRILRDGTPDSVAPSSSERPNFHYEQFSVPGQMDAKGETYTGRYEIGGSYVDNGDDSLFWITHRFFRRDK